ncbi:hypothetical protein BsIDN1_43990 [Bacillus safensis]|uniref:Uncharacterized protein n=1 Tax=Bacillus safensis TaxID=561879 RepID=A0A5S9MCX4_BACIA|nr:hypothetical protein BsIDN1_43990 [Bacillus safensis]
MADKQAHETETELTFEQVRDKLTETGKKTGRFNIRRNCRAYV